MGRAPPEAAFPWRITGTCSNHDHGRSSGCPGAMDGALTESAAVAAMKLWHLVFCGSRSGFVLFCFVFGLVACGNLSSPTRGQTDAHAVEAQSLNHWTTREVREVGVFFNQISSAPSFSIIFPGCLALHQGLLLSQEFRGLPLFNKLLFCLNQLVPFLLLATKSTNCILQVKFSHENKNLSVSSASYYPKLQKQSYLIHDWIKAK